MRRTRGSGGCKEDVATRRMFTRILLYKRAALGSFRYYSATANQPYTRINMFKLFLFVAFLAFAAAAPAPAPAPAPGTILSTPLVTSYSAPIVSSLGTPLAYSAYSPPLAYSAYASPYSYALPYAYKAGYYV